MKNILIQSVIASCLCTLAQAQTTSPTVLGGVEEIAGAIGSATNWPATSGYGKSMNGGGNLVFADLAYNFNQNVGVILGIDNVYGGGRSDWNDVRGGISLSLPVHPFTFLGGTNFLTRITATPFVADLLATPRSGNAIGNVVVTGAKIDLWNFRNFNLGILGAYENRQGQGDRDGHYALIGLAITRQ